MTYLSCLFGDKQGENSATTSLVISEKDPTTSCFLFLSARFASEILSIVCMSLWNSEVSSKICTTCNDWFVFVSKKNGGG